MKVKVVGSVIGAIALGLSATASAVPVTDVQEYSNNTATEYFVENDASKTNWPYYRGAHDDWGWTHGAIAGSSFSSILLNISAYDVDYESWSSYYQGERDMIYAYDGSAWVGLGDLDGSNDTWDFTTFDLTGYGWAQAQVNTGLQVKIDIDTLNEGWYVTLGKATLSVNGGNQVCVPTPGVPCVPGGVNVPEPSSMALFGLGLLGLGLSRRRQAKK